MKKIYKDFIYNLKEYLKYIAKVGFKELFINVLILILLLVIAAFAYVPVGLVKDLVRSFLSTFVSFNTVTGAIFEWLFNLIGAAGALTLFAYLFTTRFDFKNHEVIPVEGKYTLKREEKPEKKEETEEDLPKEKEEK